MSFPSIARSGLAKVITAACGTRAVTSDGAAQLDLPDQAIYYGNHSSHLDFLTIWAALPEELRRRARPIAAEDYWGSGLRKILAHRVFNAHLVNRHGLGEDSSRHTSAGASPKGQIEAMTAVLDVGDSLIIFPEGTRGDGETLAQFHSGLYRLAAHDPSIPVVPVALTNLGRMLPKGEAVPVPHLSTVVFCAPISVGPGEEKDAFLDRARGILADTLAKHRPDSNCELDDDADTTNDSGADRRGGAEPSDRTTGDSSPDFDGDPLSGGQP